MTARACKGNCSRCCCCGSEQLRELPNYQDSEGRRIVWDFSGGVFNGDRYYLERVVPQWCGMGIGFADTDEVCLRQYKLLSSSYYGLGYYGDGYTGYACLGSSVKRGGWVKMVDTVCSYPSTCLGSEYSCTKSRLFLRLKAHPCDMVLTVARCKPSTLACRSEYTPPSPPSVDTCAYLVTARLKISYFFDYYLYKKTINNPSNPNNCDLITLPEAGDVPTDETSMIPNWTFGRCANPEFFEISRSRVFYDLKEDSPPDIEFGLTAAKTMTDCCSDWAVPTVDCAGIPKPTGFNDEAFGCLLPANMELEVEGSNDGCGSVLCPNLGIGYACLPTFTVTTYTHKFIEAVDDIWRFSIS
jgi:hypothetical protein